MLTEASPVTGAAIKQAIESRDGRTLSSFYADDALLRVIDRNNPPSRPRDVPRAGGDHHLLGRHLQPGDDASGGDERRRGG